MSETVSIPSIKISNADEFRVAAKLPLFADKAGNPLIIAKDRGRLPFRAFAKLLISLQLKGLLTTVDTTYFQISRWALDEVVSGHNTRDEFSYVIAYTVKGIDGEHKLTLTDNEVGSYLPNVKGKMNTDRALMLVALHLNVEEESAPVTLLTNYTVSGVERVLTSELDAIERVGDDKGENTGEQTNESDKAAEDVKPEETSVIVDKTETSEEVKPETVPAENKPKRTSRKTTVKA